MIAINKDDSFVLTFWLCIFKYFEILNATNNYYTVFFFVVSMHVGDYHCKLPMVFCMMLAGKE